MELNNIILTAFFKRTTVFQYILLYTAGSMKASRDLQVYNLN